MKTRVLFITLILIAAPAVSYSQIGGLLKKGASKVVNSVGRAAAKEANKEIDSVAQARADKIVSDVADSIRVENENNEDQAGSNRGQAGLGLGKLFGGKVDMKYNEEYNFTSRIYMQVESYDNNEVAKLDLFMYYSSSSPSVGMETLVIADAKGSEAPPPVMIMDGENKCFIVLTDINGEKRGIISTLPEDTEQPAKETQASKIAASENYTFGKTGNTRVIAGYKCDEYAYKDPEDNSSGKVWFTKDASLKIDKRGWQRTGMGAFYGYEGFDEGVLLAGESYDGKGKMESKFETKEINPNFNKTFSVRGYSLMQINLGGMGQQNN